MKCFEFEVSQKTKGLVRKIVTQADVVVCALDEPPARRVINEVCVEEGKGVRLRWPSPPRVWRSGVVGRAWQITVPLLL